MFCPFCKAEYRAGVSRCSDCSFALVESVPRNDTDPNFMVLLWNGESLPFLETVCAELDRTEIPVATPRVDILLRDPADRYHLKHLKTFPYVLGVFKRDFAAARRILEAAAESSVPPIYVPPVAAYPQPVDELAAAGRWGRFKASLDATTAICSSDDLRYVEFLEASLDGLDIAYRRVGLESGEYEIQVPPAAEVPARRVIREIASGSSTQSEAVALEDALLQDEPPQSYFLAWFLPGTYMFLLLVFAAAPVGSPADRYSDVYALLLLGGSSNLVGMVWMVYQAIRYEVRPSRYCFAALLPFTFVWYYVERYRTRTGMQRLPVAVRARMQQPPAS